MVKLVDTRDLKSRGTVRLRASSSLAPGTKIVDLRLEGHFICRCIEYDPHLIEDIAPQYAFVTAGYKLNQRRKTMAVDLDVSPVDDHGHACPHDTTGECREIGGVEEIDVQTVLLRQDREISAGVRNNVREESCRGACV